jgi:CheY-like chemotaxis protein
MVVDGRWILVVDDDPEIRELMCDAIRQEHGCTPYAAENGREALDLLSRNKSAPCLILLDVNMPVMDGLEFLEIIEKDEARSNVPVVIMTADPNIGRRTNGGALPKPFTVDALHAFVRSHCADRGTHELQTSLIFRVASKILDEKESLIQQWISRIRNDSSIPQAHDLNEVTLRNHIPALIDEMISSLVQSAKMSPIKGANAQQIGGGQAAKEHAHHRLALL